MIVYWIGCLLSILLYNFSQRSIIRSGISGEKSKLSNRSIVLISMLPLFLIAACRYNVGTDFQEYVDAYHAISQGVETRYEPLFVLLVKVLSFFGLHYQWLFIVTAFIFCAFTFTAIVRDSRDPIFSIFLLLGTTQYFMFMNGMRQMIGCSICLFALHYAYEKKFIKYVILILIAAGFHYSCIICLALYFFDKIKFNRKIVFVFLASVYVLSDKLVEIFNSFLLTSDYYSFYITRDGGELKIWLYVNIAVFLLFSFFVTDEKKLQTNFGIQSIIVALAFFNGRVGSLSRLMWIFCMPQLLSIPEYVYSVKDERMRTIIKYSIIILYFVYSTYSIGIRGSQHVNNYQVFF